MQGMIQAFASVHRVCGQRWTKLLTVVCAWSSGNYDLNSGHKNCASRQKIPENQNSNCTPRKWRQAMLALFLTWLALPEKIVSCNFHMDSNLIRYQKVFEATRQFKSALSRMTSVFLCRAFCLRDQQSHARAGPLDGQTIQKLSEEQKREIKKPFRYS